ncbi:MAG TPA: aminotransferase class V-fold PLP-dependent enzyme [Vicinamibacterales bacterium]|jgi:isopenicillin-N epimerase|nr:aminotransferase class V-fold PLP-dependent enzyme [Vicinamibacterales bacterium]
MPTFGRSALQHWLLDPECTYLNHGTVGATPRRVLERQQALRDEMERHPSRFMLRELNGHQPMPWRAVSRLREASDQVAAFLGSRPDDLVFVPNVTTGLNAVLGSMPLGAGDEVVITDLAYGAITYATEAVCERGGATLRTVQLEYPMSDAGDVVEPIVKAITPRTKLVVIDHVTAHTALVLPVAAIAAECHARAVPVLVDGAHVPGSRPLDIASLGVDWYAGNLHKWAHAPRGCGILWAAPERQSVLHNPVVSWGRNKGYRGEFEHTATIDPTAYLAAPEGIALLREWGFEACVEYMQTLAWEAAGMLTDCWRTTFAIPRAMVGTMVTVPLPLDAGTTDADAARLRLALLLEDRIEVQLHAWRGRLWARISAQIYNDRADIARLGDAVARRVYNPSHERTEDSAAG